MSHVKPDSPCVFFFYTRTHVQRETAFFVFLFCAFCCGVLALLSTIVYPPHSLHSYIHIYMYTLYTYIRKLVLSLPLQAAGAGFRPALLRWSVVWSWVIIQILACRQFLDNYELLEKAILREIGVAQWPANVPWPNPPNESCLLGLFIRSSLIIHDQ